MTPISDDERLARQLEATRVLRELLRVGRAKGLPAISTWWVSVAGEMTTSLNGSIDRGSNATRRAVFESWRHELGLVALSDHVSVTGTVQCYAHSELVPSPEVQIHLAAYLPRDDEGDQR